MDREEREGWITITKWQSLAWPKEVGEWGLKNIHFFGKAPTMKSLWKLISKERLWRQVIIQNT